MLQSSSPCSCLGTCPALVSRILGAALLVAAHRVGRQEASFLHSLDSVEGFQPRAQVSFEVGMPLPAVTGDDHAPFTDNDSTLEVRAWMSIEKAVAAVAD